MINVFREVPSLELLAVREDPYEKSEEISVSVENVLKKIKINY